MISLEDANQLIRMELRQWGLVDHACEWQELPWLGQACVADCKILLNPRLLSSYSAFVEVLKHEIAHILDYRERGTFMVNRRNSYHGKNWKKWCLTVGCRPRRFVPLQ